ncbi:MAG: hypothetical protein HC804_02915 [Anaerolineae bacterium]|nr:hypothetical protein [Anaerolineae bacterium]
MAPALEAMWRGRLDELKALAEATDALHEAIPTKLNLAEMRYILERLMSQRRLDGWDQELELEEAEVAGFSLQPNRRSLSDVDRRRPGGAPELSAVERAPSQLRFQHLRIDSGTGSRRLTPYR